MPGTHCPQTDRVIKTLLAAGYKRYEFKVRTPCNHRGEYQDVEIYIGVNDAIQEARLYKVLEGGEVSCTKYYFFKNNRCTFTHFIYKHEYCKDGHGRFCIEVLGQ